ncbi:MAG: cohesin domain-containing protein [Methanolobus sp.]|nr:cohesin domain-containing protein [Methanolobus sp.]
MRFKFTSIAVYTAFLTCFFLLIPGVATAVANVSILPATHEVLPEEEFSLQIHVRPHTPISGLQLDLMYDSSLVMISSVQEGDLFAGTGSSVMFRPGNYEKVDMISDIFSVLMKEGSVINDGIFCTVNAKAGPENGIGHFRIANLIISDEQGNALPSASFDSTIKITGTAGSVNENGKVANKDDQELNIVSPEKENAEHRFESIRDGTEETHTGEMEVAGFVSSEVTKIIMLLLTAIGFLGFAFFLDRKK